jgi:hypothetical protein
MAPVATNFDANHLALWSFKPVEPLLIGSVIAAARKKHQFVRVPFGFADLSRFSTFFNNMIDVGMVVRWKGRRNALVRPPWPWFLLSKLRCWNPPTIITKHQSSSPFRSMTCLVIDPVMAAASEKTDFERF